MRARQKIVQCQNRKITDGDFVIPERSRNPNEVITRTPSMRVRDARKCGRMIATVNVQINYFILTLNMNIIGLNVY